MRRSRDGGGIRLSCSHVSQSDTRSRSWQVLAANLFRHSMFRVELHRSTSPAELGSHPPRQTARLPVRCAASASRSLNPATLMLQTERSPGSRANSASRSPNPETLTLQTERPPETRAVNSARSPKPRKLTPQTEHPPGTRAAHPRLMGLLPEPA